MRHWVPSPTTGEKKEKKRRGKKEGREGGWKEGRRKRKMKKFTEIEIDRCQIVNKS
jgi:hypothetical protein